MLILVCHQNINQSINIKLLDNMSICFINYHGKL